VLATVNLGRKLDNVESDITVKVEINSNDLLEVEAIARMGMEADHPGWKFKYLRIEEDENQ